jgi:hypothetical protein
VHEVLLDEDAPQGELKCIENPDLGYSLKWDNSKLSLEELIKLLSE